MIETLFDPDSSAQGGGAIMYDSSGGIAHLERSDAPGSGHGYSNVHELIRFGMFHLKNHLKDQTPILDDRRIDRMQMEKSGAVHPGGGNESYGLGWFFVETTYGFRTVWHEGGWTGASAMLKLLPSENIAVAVLMNVYDREFVNQVTDETIRALLPAYGNQEGQAADQVTVSSPPQFDLPVGRYSGEIRTFSGAIPLILHREDGGELYAYLGDPASAPRRVRSAPEAVPRLPAQILATFPGPIGDQDAARHHHTVWLDLRFSNDELYGTASAMTLGGHGWEGIDAVRDSVRNDAGRTRVGRYRRSADAFSPSISCVFEADELKVKLPRFSGQVSAFGDRVEVVAPLYLLALPRLESERNGCQVHNCTTTAKASRQLYKCVPGTHSAAFGPAHGGAGT
jgi:hypothetical protein